MENERWRRLRNYISPTMMEFKLDWSLEESGHLTAPDRHERAREHEREKDK